MDYWKEEYRIYKTFDHSGKLMRSCGSKRQQDYNEKTPKKWKCGCGGHSQKITDKYNAGIRALMRTGYNLYHDVMFHIITPDNFYDMHIKPRIKHHRLKRRREAMKTGRSGIYV